VSETMPVCQGPPSVFGSFQGYIDPPVWPGTDTGQEVNNFPISNQNQTLIGFVTPPHIAY